MAMAELWFGQGRGLRNFICLGVRSGLGAGIIIDGQVYRGADNRAGEIGDWPMVLTNGEGQRGSPPAGSFARLEDLTSFQPRKRGGTASALPGPDSLESLRKAALAGDKSLLDFLDRVARVFGLVLNQLNCVFNPEKIIVAGAFTVFDDLFLRRLQESLNTFAPPGGAPAVVNSHLGPFNGAIGAAALAVHEWRPVPP
jgi:glucokinase